VCTLYALNVDVRDEENWVWNLEENIELMQADWDRFRPQLLIGDENCIHHYNSTWKNSADTKWRYKAPHRCEFKVQLTASNIMCTNFYDAESVVLIGYIYTTRGNNYMWLLWCFTPMAAGFSVRKTLSNIECWCCDFSRHCSSTHFLGVKDCHSSVWIQGASPLSLFCRPGLMWHHSVPRLEKLPTKG